MKVLDKVFKFLKNIIGPVLGILSGLFAVLFIKEVAKIGKVERKKNWAVVDDKTIAILDDNNELTGQTIKLPKDPQTKKQLKPKDIEAVGVSKEGEVNVKIKHSPVNRFSFKPDNNGG